MVNDQWRLLVGIVYRLARSVTVSSWVMASTISPERSFIDQLWSDASSGSAVLRVDYGHISSWP